MCGLPLEGSRHIQDMFSLPLKFEYSDKITHLKTRPVLSQVPPLRFLSELFEMAQVSASVRILSVIRARFGRLASPMQVTRNPPAVYLLFGLPFRD